MTVWMGVDLVAVEEVETAVAVFGARYLNRVFTEGELEQCAGDARRLAARFAAKEAVVKALKLQGDLPASPRDVEVVSAPDGPKVRLSGAVAAAAEERGWGQRVVSFSHTDCCAAAVFIATGAG
ncbi:holo-ACP synthase [Segniliparus rugosus]|uniref:Holo-[acyl-carrier-protein] synthase n=1 Tax=Segniliparus rugosus (strain ATCC BAA-974 / DSM 45345 / CCUG 50838 / CIP 108380 / JCM 13579 / CDC 945) TaxID=679197 RepID=E5XNQ6_SEGRC|nr:4'-phosphopantetheinyl transferase superfamily protein [Segniliparus rugosus]EFV14046.1 phosphopantetheine-protein transferase domain [Segniliparus rugosus ATCC BAA-974]